jgi:prepilin-type N-terminal cleavage/methylation domain-containing protein
MESHPLGRCPPLPEWVPEQTSSLDPATKPTAKTLNQSGFTMIEMILVLIVMAIVGTFVASRASMSSNDLITEVEILKSHLRYTQIRAMNDTVSWGIHIPNIHSYILYKNNTTAANYILPGEKSGVPPTPQTHTTPNKVIITSGVGLTFNFNSSGIPVDTAGNPISANQTITITQGTELRNITITKNTGYIP